MNVCSEIKKLVTYSIQEKLIDKSEYYYSINQILYLLKLDSFYDDGINYKNINLFDTINNIIEYAITNNFIEYDTIANRDYFESKIMNCICMRPKETENKFFCLYKKSPKKATDWFYDYCKKNNYIKEDRIKKDIRFFSKSEYGNLEITINLSKPEKDPKDIAKLKNAKSLTYPQCQLCITNQGYSGRVNYPSKDNLRLIPITLNNEQYYFQYSPYSYFNEHSIVLNERHLPMHIDKDCFAKLFNFIDMFPHYMIGSNADLPIVGGSILDHDHFQCGRYTFPMFKARNLFEIKIDKFPTIQTSFLNWPVSTIRLKSKNKNDIIELSNLILLKWRKYSDKTINIICEDNNGIHNTITPILHKSESSYIMDLVLRNNLTNSLFPLGLFHPHKKYWNIKKENIGLIEVMGLAILPGRLKEELQLIKEDLLKKEEIINNKILHHKKWVESFKNKYHLTSDNIDQVLKNEVGKAFSEILECCGVFKINSETQSHVLRFIERVNK